MIPLAGYADRLSARPGERLGFHVSSRTGSQVTARLIHVISADPNPEGPGLVETAVSSSLDGQSFTVSEHPVLAGSYARIPSQGKLAGIASFSIGVTVWPTLPDRPEQGLIAWGSSETDSACELFLAAGHAAIRIATKDGIVEASAQHALPERAWTRVHATFDAESGTLTIGTTPVGRPGRTESATSTTSSPVALSTGGEILIAALPGPAGGVRAHFNGKLERPFIADRVLSADEIKTAATGETSEGLIAAWDFYPHIGTSRIADTGSGKLDGTLVNAPARAMTGSTWTGAEMCWRHAPGQYGAIHFHEDDLDDCRWPEAFSWTVPDDMKSGTYALRLSNGTDEENIPFFIVPPKGKRTADLCVLVSTFTYVVYHNHARPEWLGDPKWRGDWIAQTKAWGGYPHNPGEHREYGLSTYNYHTDGSGICHASWQRPMLNVRSGFITYPYPEIRASGHRHYPADSHLITWLEKKGIPYDVITDWELHTEGHDLLKDYRVVITGSHPEYHTREMLDALEAYRDGGGRFMYMGGNGFYWKIALSKEKPGLIEIRRGEGGIRAWAAEPGEYYNAFDGEYGGLWRRNGRPPQHLTGVGFTGQGNFVGSHYRVHDDARSSRAAWILDGLDGETIGGHGLSGHGAAGFELDRTDKRLGTPSHAVVLASSEGHEPEAPWVLVPEEQLTHLTTVPGRPASELIRADLTFFEAPNNGAVFSTGSITYCGSLLTNDGDNDISRLTLNVLNRFLDPNAAFEMPDEA